jgi:hypothetical protein
MSDLTDRMRTCAAFMIAEVIPHKDDHRIYEQDQRHERVMQDAADLLVEASNVLEVVATEDLGEPMEIIPPQPPRTEMPALPNSPRACPKCHSHAANTVRREGRKLMLLCPVCGEQWEFKPQAAWV